MISIPAAASKVEYYNYYYLAWVLQLFVTVTRQYSSASSCSTSTANATTPTFTLKYIKVYYSVISTRVIIKPQLQIL